MLIFKDIVNGDEFMSDIFPFTLEYDDVIMKVPSQYKSKDKVGEVDIGCGNEFGGGDAAEGDGADGGDEDNEKVIDVIYNANLKQVNMSKKEFGAYIKDYFKKVIEHLEKNGKADRVDGFKKGATDFVKFIMKKFDDVEIYTGNNGETEDGEIVGGLAISYWENEEAKGPMIYFFKDALVEEKC